MVGLFPLLLTNNHFTLLEINERTGHIYHYDSLCQKHSALQSACQKEFPHLNYIEKRCIRQVDSASCGLMVIEHARRRMMNRPVVTDGDHKYDARKLRVKAAELLILALDEGRIESATECGKRKRQVDTERDGKRRQLNRLSTRDDEPCQEDAIVID